MKTKMPRPIRSHEKSSPRRAENRVPRLRSPVTFHAIARAIRPPSSGNAGIRLKISRTRLISPSQPISAIDGVVLTSWNVAVSTTPVIFEASAPAPTQMPTMIAVTAGPAAATMNSSFGVFESRVSLATPPNSQRSMPLVPIPKRRAASAWPSSCRSSETKKRTVAATATPNETVFDESTSTSLK